MDRAQVLAHRAPIPEPKSGITRSELLDPRPDAAGIGHQEADQLPEQPLPAGPFAQGIPPAKQLGSVHRVEPATRL